MRLTCLLFLFYWVAVFWRKHRFFDFGADFYLDEAHSRHATPKSWFYTFTYMYFTYVCILVLLTFEQIPIVYHLRRVLLVAGLVDIFINRWLILYQSYTYTMTHIHLHRVWVIIFPEIFLIFSSITSIRVDFFDISDDLRFSPRRTLDWLSRFNEIRIASRALNYKMMTSCVMWWRHNHTWLNGKQFSKLSGMKSSHEMEFYFLFLADFEPSELKLIFAKPPLPIDYLLHELFFSPTHLFRFDIPLWSTPSDEIRDLNWILAPSSILFPWYPLFQTTEYHFYNLILLLAWI